MLPGWPRFEGELEGVAADVLGPSGGVGFEAGAVVGEEGAGGFFEAGEVAGEGGEEAVSGFLGLADLVAGGVGAAGVVDEAAEGDGGAAGLGGEPVPVAGEEGDFAGDDA